jgi:DMSO reductase anchor subunit
MIYASLKPIAQWSSRYTLPGYLIFAAMTGSVLCNALLWLFGEPFSPLQLLAIALTAAAWAWKVATWRHNDGLGVGTTLNSATGLTGGEIRSIEWPHTAENYILKEMGFRIARKHGARLRAITQFLAFALPILLLAGALGLDDMALLPAALSVAATVAQLAGILAERWLFYAEAKHTVALYYGR